MCHSLIKQILNGLCIVSCCACSLEAAQEFQNNVRKPPASSYQQNLQHVVGNHEAELRQIGEKFSSLEAIVDSLRQYTVEDANSHREKADRSASFLEIKVNDLEMSLERLGSEINHLKKKQSESAALSSDLQQQIQGVEKVIVLQNQNIEHLQHSLKTLMGFLQSEDAKSSNEDFYVVQAGDTLDKIAQVTKISVKALKQINHLKSDRIRIGQKLRLKESKVSDGSS